MTDQDQNIIPSNSENSSEKPKSKEEITERIISYYKKRADDQVINTDRAIKNLQEAA